MYMYVFIIYYYYYYYTHISVFLKTWAAPCQIVKNKVFFFLRGTPPSGFQDFAQIGVKPLVSLPNKPEKCTQDYSGFSGFLPRKKDTRKPVVPLVKEWDVRIYNANKDPRRDISAPFHCLESLCNRSIRFRWLWFRSFQCFFHCFSSHVASLGVVWQGQAPTFSFSFSSLFPSILCLC